MEGKRGGKVDFRATQSVMCETSEDPKNSQSSSKDVKRQCMEECTKQRWSTKFDFPETQRTPPEMLRKMPAENKSGERRCERFGPEKRCRGGCGKDAGLGGLGGLRANHCVWQLRSHHDADGPPGGVQYTQFLTLLVERNLLLSLCFCNFGHYFGFLGKSWAPGRSRASDLLFNL